MFLLCSFRLIEKNPRLTNVSRAGKDQGRHDPCLHAQSGRAPRIRPGRHLPLCRLLYYYVACWIFNHIICVRFYITLLLVWDCMIFWSEKSYESWLDRHQGSTAEKSLVQKLNQGRARMCWNIIRAWTFGTFLSREKYGKTTNSAGIH